MDPLSGATESHGPEYTSDRPKGPVSVEREGARETDRGKKRVSILEEELVWTFDRWKGPCHVGRDQVESGSKEEKEGKGERRLHTQERDRK